MQGQRGRRGELVCNDVQPGPPPTQGSNCGLPSGEHEAIAECCPAGLTADSGPPSAQAAIAGAACGLFVDFEDCGAYRRVLLFPSPSVGPGTIDYYSTAGELVAVVQRQDAFGDTCIAGPADFVEPCDQSCTPLDAGTAPACADAGDAGGEGGG